MGPSFTPARDELADLGSRNHSHTTERTVCLTVRAGREAQLIRGSRSGVVTEGDAPEAVDHDRLLPGVAQNAGRGESQEIVGHVERDDLAVPEVADQELAARRAEPRGRNREPPGRVELAARADAGEERAVGVEHIDDAQALSVNLLDPADVLLGEGYEDLARQHLDPERGEPRGELRIDEAAGRRD